MRHRSVTYSWKIIGLAVLPGLFVAGMERVGRDNGWIAAIGVLMFVLLSAVEFFRKGEWPVWSYLALGVLFGLVSGVPALVLGPIWVLAAIAALFIYHRRGIRFPRPVWVLLCAMVSVGTLEASALNASNGLFFLSSLLGPVTVVSVILFPVATGLLLARHSGLSAGLFVVASLFSAVSLTIEPTYGLWNTRWSVILPVIQAVLLLIVPPVWVLRARSARGQIWGLLFPPFVALASIVIIVCTGRGYALVTWIVNGGTAAELFFGLALAIVLYQWISRQGRMPTGTMEVTPPDESKPDRRRREPTSTVNTDPNTVTATPAHFGLWAVLGEAEWMYLPAILKNH